MKLGHMDDEPIQLRPHLNLTAQTAIGQALTSGGIEHCVLCFVDRWQQRQELFFHINMTRRAKARTSAFSDDSVDSIPHSALHDGITDRHIDFVTLSLMRNVSDFWHVL